MKALACELPGQGGFSLFRFSTRELARQMVTRGWVVTISGSTEWTSGPENEVHGFKNLYNFR